MGKASALLEKFDTEYDLVPESRKTTFSESEIEKELNDLVGTITESEYTEEVMEALEGFESINEAASTFPKAKLVKSMQIILKKVKKALEPLRTKSQDLQWQIGRKTKKRGDKALDPKSNKRRLDNLKALKASQKKVRADIDKQLSLQSRARQQLDKLNAERKEFNKKKKSDSKKAKKAA